MAASTKPTKLRRALARCGRFAGRHYLSLCWVTYALGVVWVLLHPAATVSTGELKCRGTYMSENALLIDQIGARCDKREVVATRVLQRELASLPELPPSGCGDNCSLVLDWMEQRLRSLDRVEAYRHSFVDQRTGQTRTNVYGILRAAPLADGKESVVLVTHYRNVGNNNGESSGIAMGLALLEYLGTAKWLAKDIVLLLADDGEADGSDGFAPGTDAWLRAYHLDPAVHGAELSLSMRAGVIRAAISLETKQNSYRVDSVGIYAAGTNGQLPNLDLINTAVRALRQQNVQPVLDRWNMKSSHNEGDDTLGQAMTWLSTVVDSVLPGGYKQPMHNYLANLHGMLRFMKTLAIGPSGLHASFIGYNIDAITLSFDAAHVPTGRHVSVRDTLRATELLVRALSNLEEKLHQSFFLYVLPSTSTFVSVGEYYYPVALAVSPAIAHLMVLAQRTVGMRVAFALVALVAVEAVCGLGLVLILTAFAGDSDIEPRSAASKWWSALLLVTIGELSLVRLIWSLRSLPILSGCTDIGRWNQRVHSFEMESAKQAGAKLRTAEDGDEASPNEATEQDIGWRALKFIAMALLVYSHCILGILNYPMALVCGLFTAHFARIVPASTASRVQNAWSAVWLLLSSPAGLFAVARIAGASDALSYIVNSFASRINLLALPYVCLLYVPVHVLSLAVWQFGSPSMTRLAVGGEKHKQE